MARLLIDRLREPGAIAVEFQPIVRLRGAHCELYSLEALSRGPRGTSLERADVMFEYVRRKGQETTVDLLCIEEALRAARPLPSEPRLSLNVHGTTLCLPGFADTLLTLAAAGGVAPGRLMLEVVEHRSRWPMETFSAALQGLRELGVQVAVDDFGVAASNFRMLVDCRPDHVKIDRYLVRGCAGDRYRAGVLRSIVTLAGDCRVVPIAEGVEEDSDLALLRELGIAHFQGWLWAPSLPAAELAASGWLQPAPVNESRRSR